MSVVLTGVLVDAQNVEPGDVSGDMTSMVTGKRPCSEDKVLVQLGMSFHHGWMFFSMPQSVYNIHLFNLLAFHT